jgi:Domain of unknown function (DUF4920)
MIQRTTMASLIALAVSAGAWAGETQSYGKPLRDLSAASLADVLRKPEAGKEVRLEGTIERVCRNKGCWLELKQGEQSVHVTFEGYSFFVPKDSAGHRAVLEGKVLVKEPAAGEASHKKSEGAELAGARVSIEAAGVEITRP